MNDVSFEAEKGEILGLFCIEGELESSLLELISGSMKADRGQVIWESEDVTSKSKANRGFYFNGGKRSSKLRIVFNVRSSQHTGESESFTNELDEALNQAESVLIIQSKFALIDRQTRERKIARLKETVRKRNLCALFATNSFEEVFAICDHVAVFGGGKLLQIGTPREVYETPNSVAVSCAAGINNVFSAQRVSSSKADTPQFITIEGEHLVFTGKLAKASLAPINQNVNLSIRPEHISISFGASFPEDNLLKAEIKEINYLGATTLLLLNAGGLTLKALVLRLVGLNIGEECMVGLPPDRIQVLNS